MLKRQIQMRAIKERVIMKLFSHVVWQGAKHCLKQVWRCSTGYSTDKGTAAAESCGVQHCSQPRAGSASYPWQRRLGPKGCCCLPTDTLNEVKAITIFHILTLHGEDPPFSCKLNFTILQSNSAYAWEIDSAAALYPVVVEEASDCYHWFQQLAEANTNPLSPYRIQLPFPSPLHMREEKKPNHHLFEN